MITCCIYSCIHTLNLFPTAQNEYENWSTQISYLHRLPSITIYNNLQQLYESITPGYSTIYHLCQKPLMDSKSNLQNAQKAVIEMVEEDPHLTIKQIVDSEGKWSSSVSIVKIVIPCDIFLLL